MVHDGFAVDAVGLAELIRAREVSPVEVVRSTLERIESFDRTLNSCPVVLEREALTAAQQAEQQVLAGEPLGPLHGVPISIKETIAVRGAPWTQGVLAFRDVIAEEDAVAVERLRAAGAIVVAKTNVPELSYWAHTDNRVYGLTRNPWDLDRTPGGSSGGAGAAVSAGLMPVALGSDAGGSIRVPAAFCGVAGIKPTFGLIPLTSAGATTVGSTLFVVGPLARSVRDLAVTLDVLAGPHSSDFRSLPELGRNYMDSLLEADIESLRVAYSADFGYAPVDASIRAVFDRTIQGLASAGWHLEEAYPRTPDPLDLGALIFTAEAYPIVERLIDEFGEQLDPETVSIFRAGADISARDYAKALEERARYARVWREFFDDYDLLLTPTTAVTAFLVGTTGPSEIEGSETDPATDAWYAPHSYPANLTLQPAASVPCGFDEQGLPIGLQIFGRHAEDDCVLQAAAAWETISPWTSHKPPGRPDDVARSEVSG